MSRTVYVVRKHASDGQYLSSWLKNIAVWRENERDACLFAELGDAKLAAVEFEGRVEKVTRAKEHTDV
jgi:hypothetical protein